MSNEVASRARKLDQRGLLLVVSSPSGAGKTTLCRRLLAEFSNIAFSISYTTRPRRRTEVDGRDYHFVEPAQFDQMVQTGAFAEWAEVHGNRYGSARSQIEQATKAGRDLLFDIDWQGARDLAAQYPDDTVMVFVLPPSVDALRERLTRRATDAPEVVERRLERATEELQHFSDYRYLVVNDQLERAYDELRTIYLAEHCAQRRRATFARRLADSLPTSLAE
jgi:guanylate kinase